ncbi:MAG: type II toxin-antitoxin system RelE/ParE family toxin, partial [Thermodesulfobacteriota bacterium]|nr:type II toxin-antitoxin system RelE/ParE family toxin [Thermodesulfobacteriota bacterium]
KRKFLYNQVKSPHPPFSKGGQGGIFQNHAEFADADLVTWNHPDHLGSSIFKKEIPIQSSYRLRVGDYRVIYQVDTANKVVIVYHARHRKDAYKKVKW